VCVRDRWGRACTRVQAHTYTRARVRHVRRADGRRFTFVRAGPASVSGYPGAEMSSKAAGGPVRAVPSRRRKSRGPPRGVLPACSDNTEFALIIHAPAYTRESPREALLYGRNCRRFSSACSPFPSITVATARARVRFPDTSRPSRHAERNRFTRQVAGDMIIGFKTPAGGSAGVVINRALPLPPKQSVDAAGVRDG